MTLDRPQTLSLNHKVLTFPSFFPSISSVKTALSVQDYLSVLVALDGLVDRFLVSAFDLAADQADSPSFQSVKQATQSTMITLMDSGNYESFWKDAKSVWTSQNFHSVLAVQQCDLTFGFDDQNPPEDHRTHLNSMVSQWERDQAVATTSRIVPIVHGDVDYLPLACRSLVEQTGISMLAVAERRLGLGLIDRAKTIARIRSELDNTGNPVFLHILGTGNPASIAVFAMQGADSFDGLEWCQTVVNYKDATLHHLSHADFFLPDSGWGTKGLSSSISCLGHNLDFISNWLRDLAIALSTKSGIEFCRNRLPQYVFEICADKLGWSPQ